MTDQDNIDPRKKIIAVKTLIIKSDASTQSVKEYFEIDMKNKKRNMNHQ